MVAPLGVCIGIGARCHMCLIPVPLAGTAGVFGAPEHNFLNSPHIGIMPNYGGRNVSAGYERAMSGQIEIKLSHRRVSWNPLKPRTDT